MKDAKAGLASLKSKFVQEKIGGQEYVFSPTQSKDAIDSKNPLGLLQKNKLQTTFLMPDYDEYGMSYKNRIALFNTENASMINRAINAFNHMIVIDGMIAGAWKRIIKNNTPVIEISFFNPLSKIKQQAVNNAVKRYCSFFS
jgi:hypothetical protein